jgi:hypothetical protein
LLSLRLDPSRREQGVRLRRILDNRREALGVLGRVLVELQQAVVEEFDFDGLAAYGFEHPLHLRRSELAVVPLEQVQSGI